MLITAPANERYQQSGDREKGLFSNYECMDSLTLTQVVRDVYLNDSGMWISAIFHQSCMGLLLKEQQKGELKSSKIFMAKVKII